VLPFIIEFWWNLMGVFQYVVFGSEG